MNVGEGERLARFLAHAGIASRRHAEELIAAGRVQVNGTLVTAQGTRIDPLHDIVSVDGKPVQAPTRYVYLALHKPTGYISTVFDPQGRPTVLDLLPEQLRRLRVYPVGRLDNETSGLLLLTNDGDFTLHLSHPRYAREKRYIALVQGCPAQTTLAQLRRGGVEFTGDDGRSHRTAPAQVRLVRGTGQRETNCELELILHEGRKRQVRRMLAALGHPVLQLQRISIGPLNLDDLPVGKWRYLTEEEVQALMRTAFSRR